MSNLLGKEKSINRREVLMLGGLVSAGWVGSEILAESTPPTQDISNIARAQTALRERTDRHGGNSHGSLTLLIFNDFLCPICKMNAPDIASVVHSDGDVRVEYRDLALFGPMAERAALVGHAFAKLWNYALYHEAMMAVRQPLTDQLIARVVSQAGGSWPRVLEDLDTNTNAYRERLLADTKLAFSLGLVGTPAFLIGNLMTKGRVEAKGMETLFAKARL